MKTITLLGCGLIGSSILRAVRAHFPQARLCAMDADPATREFLRAENLADIVTENPADAVREADLVILAVPVQALGEVAAAIAPALKQGALVTDVASVKVAAWESIAPYLPKSVRFIPGHPIAGSEKSGARAGQADLFAGKRVILTPPEPQAPGLEELADFWQALDAKVEFMPPDLHDSIYACVSHLPQYLAFIINRLYAQEKVLLEIGGDSEIFRRFTRLSTSDIHLWEGIFEANNANIAKCLERYLHVLNQIRTELSLGSGEQQKPVTVDKRLVATELFPRIAASCLVTVVIQQERELGTSLKRYAGSGFADFTAPALAEPEAHLAHISDHAPAIAALLENYASLLVKMQ